MINVVEDIVKIMKYDKSHNFKVVVDQMELQYRLVKEALMRSLIFQ